MKDNNTLLKTTIVNGRFGDLHRAVFEKEADVDKADSVRISSFMDALLKIGFEHKSLWENISHNEKNTCVRMKQD